MTVLQMLTRRYGGNPPRHAVLVESVADDVAAYYIDAFEAPDPATIAARGWKMTERGARLFGFTIPEGKHYRR
jgi:hypothetical protein